MFLKYPSQNVIIYLILKVFKNTHQQIIICTHLLLPKPKTNHLVIPFLPTSFPSTGQWFAPPRTCFGMSLVINQSGAIDLLECNDREKRKKRPLSTFRSSTYVLRTVQTGSTFVDWIPLEFQTIPNSKTWNILQDTRPPPPSWNFSERIDRSRLENWARPRPGTMITHLRHQPVRRWRFQSRGVFAHRVFVRLSPFWETGDSNQQSTLEIILYGQLSAFL